MNAQTQTFDPDTFLNTQQEGELETEYSPIPEGEYQAVIEKISPETTRQGSPLLAVMWRIDAPGNEEAHERQARQTVWLDLTESGSLDRGKNKNVALGRLLTALDLNGKTWSPGQLQGMVAKVNIKHRVTEDGVFSDVKGVTKL